MNRQKAWQHRQIALGNCIVCGKPRGDAIKKCAICTARHSVLRKAQRDKIKAIIKENGW